VGSSGHQGQQQAERDQDRDDLGDNSRHYEAEPGIE
jgi:hypothetical protein